MRSIIIGASRPRARWIREGEWIMVPRKITDRCRMVGCLVFVLPLLGLAVAIGVGVRL